MRLAFERHGGGSSDVFTVRSALPGLVTPTNLTANAPWEASSEADPTWAPPSDGPAALAFESDLGGDLEIYTFEPDPPVTAPDDPSHRPQERRQLTDNSQPDTDPAWAPRWPAGDAPENSPDDRPPIAFVRGASIFVKSYDRVVESNLTSGMAALQGAVLSNPDWSPDGQHIAFDAAWPGRQEIWVIRVTYVNAETGPDSYEGSDPRPVTAGKPPSVGPSWFSFNEVPVDVPPPSPEDEVPNRPLSDPQTCPDFLGGDCYFAPAERIVFAGLHGRDLELIFASYEERDPARPFAEAEGITEWVLTDNLVDDAAPAWSPFGDQIVFVRAVDGQPRLHAVSQDGEEESRLAITEGNSTGDLNPAWEATFLTAGVRTRLPCGRYSTRPRCKRVARSASQLCPSGEPPPCVPPERCASGEPPPCVPPERCPSGQPPPCETTERCPSGEPPPCLTPPQPKCTKVGGRGPDLLRGTPGKDILCGGRGNDTLIAAGGHDLLRGGPGNDRLGGGPGRDRLLGEQNADRLDGGPGADRADGGPGGDRLTGGSGRDRLHGGPGADRIAARDGQRDVVIGASGEDRASVDRRGDALRSVELPRWP